jgi:hypothetical protein
MYAVILHAHQKLDRVAYRHLQSLIDPDVFFPRLRKINHFEGQRGPDSTNYKRSTTEQQPWHFVDPYDAADTDLHKLIANHCNKLTEALTFKDEIRASFEAAWLAHAIVDGLTPAHHYPYEKELSELRGGETRHTRQGLVGWMYVRGDTRRDSFRRSYQLIGPKGLLTTHTMFEGGAFTIMAPLRLPRAKPTSQELIAVRTDGVTATFKRIAREVAGCNLYTRFYAQGWTPKLARDIRTELAPRMAKMITLAWYASLCDAHLVAEPQL